MKNAFTLSTEHSHFKMLCILTDHLSKLQSFTDIDLFKQMYEETDIFIKEYTECYHQWKIDVCKYYEKISPLIRRYDELKETVLLYGNTIKTFPEVQKTVNETQLELHESLSYEASCKLKTITTQFETAKKRRLLTEIEIEAYEIFCQMSAVTQEIHKQKNIHYNNNLRKINKIRKNASIILDDHFHTIISDNNIDVGDFFKCSILIGYKVDKKFPNDLFIESSYNQALLKSHGFIISNIGSIPVYVFLKLKNNIISETTLHPDEEKSFIMSKINLFDTIELINPTHPININKHRNLISTNNAEETAADIKTKHTYCNVIINTIYSDKLKHSVLRSFTIS